MHSIHKMFFWRAPGNRGIVLLSTIFFVHKKSFFKNHLLDRDEVCMQCQAKHMYE
jgi:hypothetical protein